jgi:Tfp pilus assembly protein PilO
MLADKIIQIERSHRRVLLVALAVVASVGLYRWILAPYQGQLLAAQQYESTLDSVINKTDVLGTTMQEKRAKVEKLTGETARLQNQLFTLGEFRAFFASLQSAVYRAGCTIQSVSAASDARGGLQNQPEDGSGIVSKRAVVTVIGGYGDIVRFLKELQTYERKVWVESVKLGTGDNVGKLKCQMVLTLYCVGSVETTLYE